MMRPPAGCFGNEQEGIRHVRHAGNGRIHPGTGAQQFGPQANAYVTSAVHAVGRSRCLSARSESHAGAGCSISAAAGACELHPPRRACARWWPMTCPATCSPPSLPRRRRGVEQYLHGEGVAESLPFGDASFDVVVSRYSAHHWHDLDAGLSQARRVLGPQGRRSSWTWWRPSIRCWTAYTNRGDAARSIPCPGLQRVAVAPCRRSGRLPGGGSGASPPAARISARGHAHPHPGGACGGDPLASGVRPRWRCAAIRDRGGLYLHARYGDLTLAPV